MSNPVAQTVMRCNVDVKYIGRTFAEADLSKFCDGTVDEELGLEVPVSASSPSGLSGSGLREMELKDPAPGSSARAAQAATEIWIPITAVAASSSDLPHVESAIATGLDGGESLPKKRCTARAVDTEPTKMRAMRKALQRILDLSRDAQDVGFYAGEYAPKKFQISRSMLPELYAGVLLWWRELFFVDIWKYYIMDVSDSFSSAACREL